MRLAPWFSPHVAAILALGSLLTGCRTDTPMEPTPADTPEALLKPQMRVYYIAADEVEWDYAPSGMNQATGQPFDDVANVFVQNGPDRIGKVYVKALYREYTDATFTTLEPIPPAW